MITGHDIVCVAEADFDTSVWLNVQPVMTRLARAGNRVLYIESLGLRVPNVAHPADLRKIIRRLKRLLEGVKERQPNLWLLAPWVLPGHHLPFIKQFNRFALRFQVRFFMRRLHMKNPILWLYLPTGEPLIGQIGEKAVVYYAVDDYPANPGVNADALRAMENRVIAQADAVMVTAPALLEKFREKTKRLTCIPNGADTQAFLNHALPEPADLNSIPHPRIGFSGNLTEYKVDFQLLDSVIKKTPEFHYVFIGPLGAGDPSTRPPTFLSYPNVHWLGEKPYPELPSYLTHWDVGVIPYKRTVSTDAVFPIKFFEYLAAGLPIVATALPSLLSYETVCARASDPDTFTIELKKAVAGAGKDRKERIALARQNSWDTRVEDMSQFLNSVLDGEGSVLPVRGRPFSLNRWLDALLGTPLLFLLHPLTRKKNPRRPPQRILVIKLAAMGDTFLMRPVLKAMKAAYPQAQIDWLVSSINESVARTFPEADRILLLPGKSPRAWGSLISRLRSERYDMAFDFEQWARATPLITWLSGAPERFGFDTPGHPRTALFTRSYRKTFHDHESQEFMHLAELGGVRGPLPPFEIEETAEGKQSLLTACPELGQHSSQKRILLHPGCGHDGLPREWPIARYMELARWLQETHHALIYVSGGLDDLEKANRVAAGIPGSRNLAGKISWMGTVSLVQHMDLVISGNTGTMHIAAGLKKPQIALHGPTNPLIWGPLNPNATVIQSTCPECPCLRLGFEYHTWSSSCMEKISLQEVQKAVESTFAHNTPLAPK